MATEGECEDTTPSTINGPPSKLEAMGKDVSKIGEALDLVETLIKK